jgi:putative flippase GtrA
MKSVIPQFRFITYRYRFLLLYVIFGLLSLVAELLVTRALISFGLWYPVGAGIGLIAGILLAFVLNTRFNFKIAKGKIKRSLLYFSAISLVAFGFQVFIRRYLIDFGISMDVSRFLIAGTFFIVSYLIHRRITFKEYKKVGVAIYADGVEDIRRVHEKIAEVCDFIHLDIVDSTYKKNCADIKAYRAEVVRAYWGKKEIEVHIM